MRPRPTARPVTAVAAAALAIGGATCGLAPPPLPAPTAPAAGGPVQLLVEPDAGPSAVLDLISSATRSVWMEMYMLTDARAIAALVGRAAAGCDVRVLLEPAPFESADANQAAFDQLAAGGVDVRWTTARFTFTHAKTFTIDHARLAVLTLNLTGAGLGGNREYAAVDDDAADVAAAEALFAADLTGATTAAPGGRVVSSPESTRPTLRALIASAGRAIAVETEEMTDGEIVAALAAAAARGVAVTLVWPGPTGGATFTSLAAAGATVRALTAPEIHGKVLVVDQQALYVGSANLTPTSLDANREIGLRLSDLAAATQIATVVAADAARGVPP